MTSLQFPNWFQNTRNCPVPYFWPYRIPTESDAKLAESGIFFLSVYLDAEKPQKLTEYICSARSNRFTISVHIRRPRGVTVGLTSSILQLIMGDRLLISISFVFLYRKFISMRAIKRQGILN